MTNYVGIGFNNSLYVDNLEFIRICTSERIPIAYKSDTWLESLFEMFPDLSRSEIVRRIKSGGFNTGDTMCIKEAEGLIGLLKPGEKGFDWQVVRLGKLRGIIICSERLREAIIA